MKHKMERNVGKRWLRWGLTACLIAFGGLITVNAQNRKIEFETKMSWEKALKKAKKQNKLIFLDCYTKWCGFCKVLDNHVFTVDTVADFYNERFINIRMDMEEGIGPSLQKKYGINAYPTLLFIDAEENMVDCRVGFAEHLELIDLAQRAMDPERNLAAMEKQYQAGNRMPDFLEQYMEMLKRSVDDMRCKEIIDRDLASLSDEAFYTPAVWSLLSKHIDASFELFRSRVIENQAKFDRVIGRLEVDSVIDQAFMRYLVSATHRASVGKMDVQQVQVVKEFIQTHRMLYAGEYMAILYLIEHLNKADYAATVQQMKETLKYNLMRTTTLDNYVNIALRAIPPYEDLELRREAADMIRSLPAGFILPAKKPMYDYTYQKLLGIEPEK